MHDDGARASSPAFAPPPGVLRWSRGLRLAIVLHLVRCAVSWLRMNPDLLGALSPPLVVLFSVLSLLLGIVIAVLWLGWINACRQHLIALDRKPSFGPLGAIWALLLLVPVVVWVLQLHALRRLVADTDPRQLPPVTEEREQDGGFRQSSVVRVELGSVARPLFPLWLVTTGLSVAFLCLSWREGSTALMTARTVAQLVSALVTIHLVGAVTHNLGELERRVRR